jgi:hypothetical protein
MRNLTLTASLVVVLATATPLSARPDSRHPTTPRDPESRIVRTIKQVVKKVFGISLNSEVTIPKP